MEEKTKPIFYSLKEVTDMLGVNRSTVVKYINNGELKASKLGRIYIIKKEDFEAFLESRQV